MRPNNHSTPPTRAAGDEHPGVVWFAEECRRNGIRVESCIWRAERAGDSQLAEFFRRAQKVMSASAYCTPQLITGTPQVCAR
jgi:hypothetical protein